MTPSTTAPSPQQQRLLATSSENKYKTESSHQLPPIGNLSDLHGTNTTQKDLDSGAYLITNERKQPLDSGDTTSLTPDNPQLPPYSNNAKIPSSSLSTSVNSNLSPSSNRKSPIKKRLTKKNKEGKPPYSYATIIKYAIKNSEEGKLTLSEIYQCIIKSYPYYSTTGVSWKNAVRHNLSLKKCFVRVARPADEPGKGAYWTVDERLDDKKSSLTALPRLCDPNLSKRKSHPSRNEPISYQPDTQSLSTNTQTCSNNQDGSNHSAINGGTGSDKTTCYHQPLTIHHPSQYHYHNQQQYIITNSYCSNSTLVPFSYDSYNKNDNTNNSIPKLHHLNNNSQPPRTPSLQLPLPVGDTIMPHHHLYYGYGDRRSESSTSTPVTTKVTNLIPKEPQIRSTLSGSVAKIISSPPMDEDSISPEILDRQEPLTATTSSSSSSSQHSSDPEDSPRFYSPHKDHTHCYVDETSSPMNEEERSHTDDYNEGK